MTSQRAYCDQPHPCSDKEADRWCELYHRPASPVDLAALEANLEAMNRRRFRVRCEDGVVRHDLPFVTKKSAADWAEWGHICTNKHTITELEEEEHANG